MDSLRVRNVVSPSGTHYQRYGRSFYGFEAALSQAQRIVEADDSIVAVAFPDVDAFDEKTQPNDTRAYTKSTVRDKHKRLDADWYMDADLVPRLFDDGQAFHLAARDVKPQDGLRAQGKILFIFPVRRGDSAAVSSAVSTGAASDREPSNRALHYDFKPGALSGGLRAVGV